MSGGPERQQPMLRDEGIDAVNLHRSEWSAGLVTLFHRFERHAWGWDAQHERMIVELLQMGDRRDLLRPRRSADRRRPRAATAG